MLPMKVLHYRSFAIDRRDSMEIYADRLQEGLSACAKDLEITQFAPRPWLATHADHTWRMRFDRYAAYPLQVRGKRAGEPSPDRTQ